MRFGGPIPFAANLQDSALPAGEDEDSAVTRETPMDEAAFRDFYEETAPRLRGYLRRTCGNPALADDLAQETFYRFLRARLPRGDGRQLRAYLYRIASSLVVDHWRQIERERRRNLAMPEESAPERNEDTDAMRVFHRLKPRDQTLLWLAYVEGFDHAEIASAVNVREKSVRVLLFRARKRLEEALRADGAGPAVDQGSRQ